MNDELYYRTIQEATKYCPEALKKLGKWAHLPGSEAKKMQIEFLRPIIAQEKNGIMTPTQNLNRILAPWLLLAAIAVALLFAGCSKTEIGTEFQTEIRPTFTEWEWAECLPSAAGYNCPGDKPSWDIYDSTGVIVWRYYVEGRSLYTDEYGQVWMIYQSVYCLNSEGERVGTHHNMGFRGFQFRPDPVTGELPNADDWGVTEGVLCIFGVIKGGRVLPVLW